MKSQGLEKRIEAIFQRISELGRLGQKSPALRASLAEAMEEWRNTLEELSAADEELRTQNEELAEHARAEAELRDAHEKLYAFMQSSPLAILGIGPSGRIMSWNRGAEKMFGWSEREAIGQICPTVVPEGIADFHDMVRRVTQGASVTGLLRRQQRRDGTIINASLSAAPLRNSAGESLGIMVILEDITEHERAKDLLHEREKQFRLLVSSVKDYALFMLDPQGRVISWNAGAERIKGYSAEEIVGQHFSRFYPPEDIERGKPENELKVTVAEGRIEDEGWRLRKDGTRFWANVIITAMRDETGTLRGFSKVTRDLTDRKRSEEQLKKSLQEARMLAHRVEAVREEERTRIAREVHDELGVTMTCMKFDLLKLNSLLVQEAVPTAHSALNQKVQDLLQQVDNTIIRVQRLATELRPGILDDLGLVAAIEWQAQDFATRTGITCDFLSNGETPSLDRDRTTAIFRIFQEALTNIARHAQATHIAVRLWEEEGVLALEVKDDGRGIPKEKLSDIHSLGLVGMRERVVPFGGEVAIKGVLGSGTIVSVKVPLDKPPS